MHFYNKNTNGVGKGLTDAVRIRSKLIKESET